MATHKTNVKRDFTPPPPSNVRKPFLPSFLLPPKASRVIQQNSQEPTISKTAVDGTGKLDPAADAIVPVRIVALPARRDPVLKESKSIDLSATPPPLGIEVSAEGNVLLYADSTNGTDRVFARYARSSGAQNEPQRVMVPGRQRRDARFKFLYLTWNVVAGATATIEIYDDPDGVLEIIN